MYQADSREAIHLACDDAPTDRCFCVRLRLRARREADPALIDVVTWPTLLITNPAEASFAEPCGLIAPALHAIQALWWIMPFHENETDAAENTTVP